MEQPNNKIQKAEVDRSRKAWDKKLREDYDKGGNLYTKVSCGRTRFCRTLLEAFLLGEPWSEERK